LIDYAELNPEQREAVFSGHPRVLCLAGAGTGKTRVLTRRVARLWEAGGSPENMLALTFTRAAGAEMKERVIDLIGNDGKRLFCNTFHAFCAEVIREFAGRLGYEPNFSVYDQQEADELAAEVLDDLRYKIPAKRLTEARAGKYGGMTAAVRKQAERALSEYRYRLKRNNAFDFDGLIETVGAVLSDQPDILAALRERYKHVFVDEFQDTDKAQWDIVTRLNPENLFVAGDDFQSIYGFRGSDITIILGLANNPEWHTVKLERNYRSTLPIITAANALIKHNKQTEKALATDKPGAAAEYREPDDDETEITDVIERLEENQRLGRWKTTAILARTNKQLDRAKAILTARGVPRETNGAADNPFASAGAKELLTWIAAIENPRDDAAVRKIAAAKMSKAAILKTEQAQLSGTETFAEALSETEDGIRFLDYFDEQRKDFVSAQDAISGAIRLKMNLGIEDRGAIYEISRWIQRQTELGESASAAALLEWVRLGAVGDKPAKERDASKTYLTTEHGSTGL
jgi:DNA helicase-2/ATP-dependent DNA helicase PcrA